MSKTRQYRVQVEQPNEPIRVAFVEAASTELALAKVRASSALDKSATLTAQIVPDITPDQRHVRAVWNGVHPDRQQAVAHAMLDYVTLDLHIKVTNAEEAALAIEVHCAGGLEAFVSEVTV